MALPVIAIQDSNHKSGEFTISFGYVTDLCLLRTKSLDLHHAHIGPKFKPATVKPV